MGLYQSPRTSSCPGLPTWHKSQPSDLIKKKMLNSHAKFSLKDPIQSARLKNTDRQRLTSPSRPILFRIKQPSRHHSPYIFNLQFNSAISIVSKIASKLSSQIPRILQWRELRAPEEEKEATELRSPSPSRPASNSPSEESDGTSRKAVTQSALPPVLRSTWLLSSNISPLR